MNVNIKLEAQQKKLKTVRGSYTDLDLSIHAKKGPEKSRKTLPLKFANHSNSGTDYRILSSCLRSDIDLKHCLFEEANSLAQGKNFFPKEAELSCNIVVNFELILSLSP
jgi:hypothetical protein